MNNKNTNTIAIILLIFMATLAVASVYYDSVTMDESSHLPAGYSYVSQADMRINPEHPPVVKDLAGIPLLFVPEINFPYQSKSWTQEVNGQWGFGADFLYHSGNNPDKMIFLGRLPIIAILILLGFFVFKWTKELFGGNSALLALFLYSFSPTLLAHGRLVTTDVAAAFGAFTATYYFVKFLKHSSAKNLILSGIFLGIAELLKFSLILLVPLFGVLVIFWPMTNSESFKEYLKKFWFYFVRCVLIGLVGLFLIWLVYLYHVWNYPPDLQIRDIKFILSSFGVEPLKNLVIWMADKPIFRPFAQYMLGLFMVLQRASGGNTGYFFGEISAAGWKGYFPFVYLAKEPLAFIILLFTAIIYSFWLMAKKIFSGGLKYKIHSWLKHHFAEFAMLLFVLIYWTTSLKSNLNIGVRHLLPVFPFTISLAAGAIMILIEKPKFALTKKIILAGFLVWQAVSVLLVFPSFLSYFNEAIGAANGYKYVVDSNYDWGQDLRRLSFWVEKNNIDKIYVDYFGGGSPQYYLGNKYQSWWGTRSPKDLKSGDYLAVSATFLQGGRGAAHKGFTDPTDYYMWLNNYTPVARIGYSIFIYKMP